MSNELEYTLRVTRKQLETIMHAGEGYDRGSGGQIRIALEEMAESNKMAGIDRWDTEGIEAVEQAWYKLLPIGDPRRSTSCASWVERPAGLEEDYENPALIIREVAQTIRQMLALELHPEGGFQTCFQDPFHVTKQALPILTKDNE